MSGTKKRRIPTPPEPPCTATFPIDPKRPGARRETFWAEGGRIIHRLEDENGNVYISSVDRIDLDFTPSGEPVGGVFYDWSNPTPLPPSLAAREAEKTRRAPLTAEQRSERARLAARARWSRTRNRSAELAKARAAFMARFERDVDPNGEMPPEARAKAAESARSAYFARLAQQSAKVRSRKNGDP